MPDKLKALYVTKIGVKDPNSGIIVSVGIYKDPESNGLFGVEVSFLEQTGNQVWSPFNKGTVLICEKTPLI